MTTNAPAAPADANKAMAPINEDKLDLRKLLDQDSVKARFRDVLGKEAGVFSSSLLTVYNGNAKVQLCTPKSIMNAGFQAAACHLSINPNLGHAAIVPYKNRKKVGAEWIDVWEAQFQIMWKGIVQLALRTAQYTAINMAPVYEGQLVSHDPFTGTVVLNAEGKTSDKVVGVYFYFALINGYKRHAYWTVLKCLEHGYRYSKAFSLYASGQWVDDANIKAIIKNDKVDGKALPTWLNRDSGTLAMCAKTVGKMELTKWGILSTEMQKTLELDQAVIKDDGTPRYVDNPEEGDRNDGDAKPPVEPQRASEAAKAAQKETEGTAAAGFLVEDVAAPSKRNKEWQVLIAGKSYTCTEVMAKAAQGFKEKKTRVMIDSSGGILTEIQGA